jgi:methyl-accepting chemotaxis protein
MSIKTKIVIVFSTTVIILGVLIGSIILKSSSDMIVASISSQAQDIARRVVKQMDHQDFKMILSEIEKADKKNRSRIINLPEYIRLRNKLSMIREMNGLKFLYTMAKTNDGNLIYVVDGLPMGDENASLPGEIETEEYPGLEKTFTTQKTQTGDLTKDKYGALLSAYTPILDKDGKSPWLKNLQMVDLPVEKAQKYIDMMAANGSPISQDEYKSLLYRYNPNVSYQTYYDFLANYSKTFMEKLQ